MFNEIPEISVRELAEKLKAAEKFTLLDVREIWEIEMARIDDERVLILPMSRIAHEQENAFPAELRNPQAEIVVMCHHGVRSADVTAWMRQQGWKNIFSLAGGIAAYAEQVDSSVGMY